MKNRFIKILALMLALAVSLSALAACSSSTTAKKKKKKSKKNNTTVSSEYSSTDDDLSDYIEPGFDDEFEDTDFDDDPIEEPAEPDDEDDSGDEMDTATVSVFNSEPVQSNFLGFSAVYSAFTFQSDMYGRQLTEEMGQLETDRAIELGVSIARTIYYLRDNWDSRTNSFDWETEHMQAMYKWANKLKTGDVDVFIGGPGGYMLQNYHWSVGTKEGEPTTVHASVADPENNQQKVYENFGNVMAKIVKAFHQHGATNVKYVGTDTEPPTHWSKDWGGTEEERLQWISDRASESAAAMNAVHRALQREGLRNVVTTIGPNVTSETSDDNCIQYLKFYQKYVEDGACDHLSMHNYYGNSIEADNYELWTERIDQALTVVPDNENLIWDEYGMGASSTKILRANSGLYGYQMALANMAFLNKGLKTSIMWSLFDQQFPDNTATSGDSFEDGVQRCGCMPTLLRSSYVYPYYHYVNLVNNVMGQKGAEVYAGDDSCEDGVYAAMTKGPDGSYNIMVINTNLANVKVTLNFEKSLNNATLYRHVYNPNTAVSTDQTHITAVDKKIVHTNKVLVDTIVPYGVSFYTTRRIAE